MSDDVEQVNKWLKASVIYIYIHIYKRWDMNE